MAYLTLIVLVALGLFLSFSDFVRRPETSFDKYYCKNQYDKEWREWRKNNPACKWWWQR